MQTRIYDWNGTLVTKDGFLDYLKADHPEVYQEYWIKGKTDKAAKERAKPRVVELFEYASDNDLYAVELFPHVRERLEQDRAEGLVRTVFTSVSKEALTKQASRLGMRDALDEIVSLNEVMQHFRLASAIKEDPSVYVYLAQFLGEKGFDQLKSYVDDGLPRVQAAVKANEQLRQEGKTPFQLIYHFNPEEKESPKHNAGYTTINDFRHLR